MLAAAFRLALGAVEGLHDRVIAALSPHPDPGWLLLVAVAAGGAGLACWITYRIAPEAAGSGIPHVEGRLADGTAMRWRLLVPVKFTGGLLALGSGLSMGREGPTVQMGGALADALARAASADRETVRALLSAGAGAGLAAAFDAPLAGVVFVLEELRQAATPRTYVTALLASLSANLVLRGTIGDAPVFALGVPPPLPATALPWCVLVGLVTGLVGVAFNRALMASLRGADRFTGPHWILGSGAGVLAGLLACVLPAAIADGEQVAERLLHGGLPASGAAGWLAAVVGAKFVLTVASYASGAPGGIFAPLLVIGAASGLLVAQTVAPLHVGATLGPGLAMAGMAGLFTSVVRVPITGIVLIEEMTNGQSRLSELGLTALVAYMVATALRNPPIYESLCARDREREARRAGLAARAGSR